MKTTVENDILSDPKVYVPKFEIQASVPLRSAGNIGSKLQYMELLGTWGNDEEVSFASGIYWVYGHPTYVLKEELPLSNEISRWIR